MPVIYTYSPGFNFPTKSFNKYTSMDLLIKPGGV